MASEKKEKHYPSLLSKQMIEFWAYLAITILGFLGTIACLVIGIIYIFTNLVVGIILVLISFLLSPIVARSFIRYIQGRSAYRKVKALKKDKKIAQLVELTQIREIQPTKVVQLRMIFSMFALVDLGVKEAVPILYEQYRSAKENNFHPDRYHEALEILAEKMGFKTTDELFEKYKYQK